MRGHFLRAVRKVGAAAEFIAAAEYQTAFGASSTHVVSIPGDIEAGDFIFVALCANHSTTGNTITGVTAGFTEIANNDGARRDRRVYAKTADGSETNFTLSMSGTSGSSITVLVVRGAEYEVEFSTAATDPPAITPSWGSGFLCVALAAFGGTGTGQLNGYPSGYENLTGPTLNTNVNGPTACCTKQIGGASENPPAFSSSVDGIAMTIAVR